jgi:dolichol-phosphate mannosyltransferase
MANSIDHGLVSIVLPTYNEKENIIEAVNNIIRHIGDPVEVIVVDDDSPDQTYRIVTEMGDERVKVIRRLRTRGLASAINRGIIESRGEIIGWMDADVSMPADLLPIMIENLGDHDVVIGSRYVEGGRDDRSRLRVITSRLINGLASLVLGYGIKDYDSGFIVMKRQVLDSVTLMPTGHGSYFIEFIYACCRKGLKVLEVPYTFRDREKGTSKSAPSLWQFLIAGAAYGFRIFIARVRPLD